MSGPADRLGAIVAARRAADQGRLAACLAEQRRLLQEAAALRRLARAAPAGGDTADMAQTAAWQGCLCDTALSLRARARALEPELRRLRDQLALSLGREQAVDALAAAERAARQRRAARRAEDAVVLLGHRNAD